MYIIGCYTPWWPLSLIPHELNAQWGVSHPHLSTTQIIMWLKPHITRLSVNSMIQIQVCLCLSATCGLFGEDTDVSVTFGLLYKAHVCTSSFWPTFTRPQPISCDRLAFSSHNLEREETCWSGGGARGVTLSTAPPTRAGADRRRSSMEESLLHQISYQFPVWQWY